MSKDLLHAAYLRLAQRGYRPPLGHEYDDPRVVATARRMAVDVARHSAMVRRHDSLYLAAAGARLDPLQRFRSSGSSASDPLEILIAKEAVQGAHAILASIDRRSRAALKLRCMEGLSIAAIAAIQGDTKAAIGSRLDRARRALRERWSE